MKKHFITEDGIKIPAVTKEEMIEIDRIAVEETGPNLFQMMENAGRNLATLVMNTAKQGDNILVLAGTGGNGGGGICAARHLANHAYNVNVCITNEERLRGIPRNQLDILNQTSANVQYIHQFENNFFDLIIDCIIGYSLKGSPKGMPAKLIAWANEQLCPIYSLDVPSGIDSTTGECPGESIKSTKTLTLALPKTGLDIDAVGDLYLGDIGIPKAVFDKAKINYTNPFKKDYLIKIF